MTTATGALRFVGISKAITVRIISLFASFGCAKTYRKVLSSDLPRSRLKLVCVGTASAIFERTAVKSAFLLNMMTAVFVSLQLR